MAASLGFQVKPKELRDLYLAAREDGANVRMTRGGHVRVSKGRAVVHGPRTASDRRALMNLRADLRRTMGLDV